MKIEKQKISMVLHWKIRNKRRNLTGDCMNENIKILNEFKKHPYEVLRDDKDTKKLIAAINKSIKLLQKADSRKKSS